VAGLLVLHLRRQGLVLVGAHADIPCAERMRTSRRP
jgi:hypothetical protein